MTEPAKGVFLSYASEDAGPAKRICDALRAAGVDVWFDQTELRGGDAWDQRIRQQIHDCALFIPLISAHTQARPEGYFRLEWKLAVDRSYFMVAEKAFLVPVVADATMESEALVPAQFRAVQWTRVGVGEVPAAFVNRVASLLDQPVAQRHVSLKPVASRASPGRLALALIALTGAATIAFVIATAMDDRLPLRRPVLRSETESAATPVATAPSAISDKTLAVLPFVDMSERRDQEYFADGLSEELIDLLARDSDLRVSARTSSFYFKGKQTTVADVARALGVASVLEGSVRKSGETMRVTVQLIRASDGFHAWSSSYDRKIKDVFKVQDEIAAAVVSVLKAKLSTPLSTPAVRRTISSEAYEQYLLGRQFIARRTVDSFHQAVQSFKRAIAIDPKYAAAYAGLSEAQYLANWAEGGLTVDQYARSQKLLNDAIALAPDLADAYSSRGVDRMEFLGDLTGAQTDLSHAMALEPTSSTHQRRYGFLMRCLRNLPAAIRYGRQATVADPLDTFAWQHLGESLLAHGEFAVAREAFARLAEINPDDPYANAALLDVDLMEGRAAGALDTIARLPDLKLRLYYSALAEFTLGHDAKSLRALKELTELAERGEPQFELVAGVYAWRGDVGQSILWLEKAATRRLGTVACISTEPPFLRLHDNPQFRAFLQEMKLPG